MINLESKRISYDFFFLKNGIIEIIKLIVNLIMSGFSGKSKRICNLSFASDPILVPRFCLQYGSVGDGRLSE